MRRKAGMPTQEMPKPFSSAGENSYRCHIITAMAGMKTDSK